MKELFIFKINHEIETDADKVFDNFSERHYNYETVQKSYKVNTQEHAKLTFKDKANEQSE